MRAVAVALAVVLWAVCPVARAALVVLEDARYVAFDGSGSVVPTPGASLFNGHAAGFYGFSDQTSNLAPDAFTGVGTIFSEFPPADNVFDVLFTVDAPSAFSLTGQLSFFPEGSGTGFLSDSTGVVQFLTGGAGGTFALSGVLSPDLQYRLILAIQGGIGGGYDFQLAVPEPTWLALLAVTALLIVTTARRHTSSAPSSGSGTTQVSPGE